MLPYELFVSSRITITSCGRDTYEVSSARHDPIRVVEARRDIKHKKPTKSCSKACIEESEKNKGHQEEEQK